ncbi:hypothetical protein RUM43_012290 [Polyplax serrata]|uniref:Retropepsins domain-containing protein n=1 Tax=Polyplax serrata TaxID=468196 RepID=A0AAN8P3G8_POLSC
MCSVRNSFGKPGRFHPEDSCRNKANSKREILSIKKADRSLIVVPVTINKQKTKLRAIYDSGSNVTLIKKEALDKSIPVYPNSKFLKTLSGPLKCTTVTRLKLKTQNVEQEVLTYVVEDSMLNYDMLLGLDTIKKFRLIQDERLNIYQKDLKSRIFRINGDFIFSNTTM